MKKNKKKTNVYTSFYHISNICVFNERIKARLSSVCTIMETESLSFGLGHHKDLLGLLFSFKMFLLNKYLDIDNDWNN